MENYQGEYIGIHGRTGTMHGLEECHIRQAEIIAVSDEREARPGHIIGKYRDVTVNIDPWEGYEYPKEVAQRGMTPLKVTKLPYTTAAFVELLDAFDVPPKGLVGKTVNVLLDGDDNTRAIGIVHSMDEVVLEQAGK